MNLALQYGHPGTPDFGMHAQSQPLGLPPGLVSYLHPSAVACMQGPQGQLVFSEAVQYGNQSNALSNMFPVGYSSDLALRLAAAGLPVSMAAVPPMAGAAMQVPHVSMQHLAQQVYQAQQNLHHHQQQQQQKQQAQARAQAQLQMGHVQQLYLYQRAHQAAAAPTSSPPRAPTAPTPAACEPRRQPAPAAPKKRPTIAVSSPESRKIARESEWKTDPSVPVRGKQRAAPFERWADAPQPPSKKSRTNPRPSENATKTGPVDKSTDGLPSSVSPREPPTPTGPTETPDAALYRAHGFKGRGRVGMAGGLRGLGVPLSGADGPYLRSLDYRTFGTVLSLGCDIARALFPDPRTAEKEPLPVILVDPEGTEWVCMYHALVCKHSYVLRSGWRKFVETNNVLKHDIVVLGKDPRGPDAEGRYRIRIEIVSKKLARASLGLVPLGAFDMHRFRRDSLETGDGDAEPAAAAEASVSAAGQGTDGLAGPEEAQAPFSGDADADAEAAAEPSASTAEPGLLLDAPALSDSEAATCEAGAPKASVNP